MTVWHMTWPDPTHPLCWVPRPVRTRRAGRWCPGQSMYSTSLPPRTFSTESLAAGEIKFELSNLRYGLPQELKNWQYKYVCLSFWPKVLSLFKHLIFIFLFSQHSHISLTASPSTSSSNLYFIKHTNTEHKILIVLLQYHCKLNLMLRTILIYSSKP